MPDKPKTYLTPSERQLLHRLLGFPEELPQEFVAWLDDHLRVNIPQFPLTQIHGFQDFQDEIQEFFNGEGWDFIEEKGDLVVGFAPGRITLLPPDSDGKILALDSGEPSGLKWVTESATAAFDWTIIDHKGDLIVGATADSAAIVSVSGVPNGYVLTRDSGDTYGLGWAAAVTAVTASVQRELGVVLTGDGVTATSAAQTVGISALLASESPITGIRAFVATSGSADTTVTLSGSILSTDVTIQSGDNWDDETAVIDDGTVAEEDLILVSATIGSGAKGLTTILTFG